MCITPRTRTSEQHSTVSFASAETQSSRRLGIPKCQPPSRKERAQILLIQSCNNWYYTFCNTPVLSMTVALVSIYFSVNYCENARTYLWMVWKLQYDITKKEKREFKNNVKWERWRGNTAIYGPPNRLFASHHTEKISFFEFQMWSLSNKTIWKYSANLTFLTILMQN